jgi:hypothetical protein
MGLPAIDGSACGTEPDGKVTMSRIVPRKKQRTAGQFIAR